MIIEWKLIEILASLIGTYFSCMEIPESLTQWTTASRHCILPMDGASSYGCGIIFGLCLVWLCFDASSDDAVLKYIFGRLDGVLVLSESPLGKELGINAGQMILAVSVLSHSLAIFRYVVIYLYVYIDICIYIYVCTHRHKKLKLLCAPPVIVLQTNHSIHFEFHLKEARWCVQSTSSHEIGR